MLWPWLTTHPFPDTTRKCCLFSVLVVTFAQISYNTLNVRLWSAKPAMEFDLNNFNKGNFLESIQLRQNAEQITQVLYPNDNTPHGKVNCFPLLVFRKLMQEQGN